jgi:hypothetical protein
LPSSLFLVVRVSLVAPVTRVLFASWTHRQVSADPLAATDRER